MGDWWALSLERGLEAEAERGRSRCFDRRLRTFHFTLKAGAESGFVCFEVYEIWRSQSKARNPQL